MITVSKTINRLFSIIQLVVILFFVVFATISYAYKIPFLSSRGFNFYYIISGSMEPTIPVGSIVYSGKYQLESLKKGDIITFKLDKSVVTHRIDEAKATEVLIEGKKLVKYEYFTKGDANSSRDPDPIMANQVLGKYIWHLPYLGYVASFAQTPKGFVSLIVIPTIILIIWEIISLVFHFKHKYEQKMVEEIAKIKK